MDSLVAHLREHSRFILVSHVRPDGDAVGSLLGLSYGLHQLGKEVTPVLVDGVPKAFTFLTDRILPVQEVLPKPDTESICVLLDAADASRCGDRETLREYANRQRLMVIDHHPLGDLEPKALAYFHNLEASSTSEMVYHILVQLGCRITPQIATCLYCGMYTDTSGFRHSNTTTTTLEVAAELLKRGANLRKIVAEIGQQKSISRLRLTGIAMRRVMVSKRWNTAYSVVQHADILENEATPDDVTGIVNQVSVLPGVSSFMMLTEEKPGVIKGSLRVPDGTKHKISVRPLAKLLGGGGHSSAAGFEITGSLNHTDGAHGGSWRVD